MYACCDVHPRVRGCPRMHVLSSTCPCVRSWLVGLKRRHQQSGVGMQLPGVCVGGKQCGRGSRDACSHGEARHACIPNIQIREVDAVGGGRGLYCSAYMFPSSAHHIAKCGRIRQTYERDIDVLAYILAYMMHMCVFFTDATWTYPPSSLTCGQSPKAVHASMQQWMSWTSVPQVCMEAG